MTLRQLAKGCAATALVMVLVIPVAWLGWFLFDLVRPRDPMEMLFQHVIRSAPISDEYSLTTGWDEANVSAEICGKVDANALGRLSISPEHRIVSPFPLGDAHLIPADVWNIPEDTNIFAQCADHSFRMLSIELQQGTGQCRAFVQPWPTCDP